MIEDAEIRQASILIVDDQYANVALLAQLLSDAGYTRVSSTTNSHEVEALHYNNHYDLILLDLQMPGLDGFQVMECLNRNANDSYLPVLVITAQPSHKLRALAAGARDFISKPFDVTEVKTRIRNTLEVRLLYKKLENYNRVLEQQVLERTAELCESEARFRSLTELASDWYWEQDENGGFSKVYGPVQEMLGFPVAGESPGLSTTESSGWNQSERAALQTRIAERQPFLDLVFSRIHPDGTVQRFQVSGEPIFNRSSRFIGYRGIGLEITDRK